MGNETTPLLQEESSLKEEEEREVHPSFEKYIECTICLVAFKNGEKVRVIPVCNHLFHEQCLEDWLRVRVKCPNCN